MGTDAGLTHRGRSTPSGGSAGVREGVRPHRIIGGRWAHETGEEILSLAGIIAAKRFATRAHLYDDLVSAGVLAILRGTFAEYGMLSLIRSERKHLELDQPLEATPSYAPAYIPARPWEFWHDVEAILRAHEAERRERLGPRARIRPASRYMTILRERGAGYSCREIGERLGGISERTIRSELADAVAILAPHLGLLVTESHRRTAYVAETVV